MKPAWDQLMGEFEDSQTVLVADVDCDADGKSLCDSIGVKGFPTIKHGSAHDLEDYKGGRDFDALKKFADENLGPRCGPANLDLCDAAKRAEIEKLLKTSPADLDLAISEQSDAMEKVEADFKAFIDGLNKQYSAGSEKKEKDLADINGVDLQLMKSVAAARGIVLKKQAWPNGWMGIVLAVVGILVICGLFFALGLWCFLGDSSSTESVPKKNAEEVKKND